jgi:hypothetical protein
MGADAGFHQLISQRRARYRARLFWRAVDRNALANRSMIEARSIPRAALTVRDE